MKKKLVYLSIFIVGLLIGASLSNSSNTNSKLIYGDTGAPKNCRAIIKANIDIYHDEGLLSAADIIESIDRNCGEFGYSWNE